MFVKAIYAGNKIPYLVFLWYFLCIASVLSILLVLCNYPINIHIKIKNRLD